MLAHYIKGRSGQTGRLELQPVAAAAARGAATGGGFPLWCGVGSGQRPPGPLKGRGLFFFIRAILEFLAPRTALLLYLLSPLPSPPSGYDFV